QPWGGVQPGPAHGPRVGLPGLRGRPRGRLPRGPNPPQAGRRSRGASLHPDRARRRLRVSGGRTLMAMRPLDRLPSIRAKLGSVIVFAVAVTILILYIAVGFALHRSESDRQFSTASDEAKTVAALAFGPRGAPSQSLAKQLQNLPGRIVVVGLP